MVAKQYIIRESTKNTYVWIDLSSMHEIEGRMLSGKQQGRVNEMIKMECPKVVDTVDIEVSYNNIFFFKAIYFYIHCIIPSTFLFLFM